jgi:hypothetical protein
MNMWARVGLSATTDIPTILAIHSPKVDFSADHTVASLCHGGDQRPDIGSFIEKVSTPLLLKKVRTVEARRAVRLIRSAPSTFSSASEP